MIEPFTHPVSYAFMEATEENLAAAVEESWIEVDRLKRQQAGLLERMAPLRERLAVLRGPANLPPRGRRTRAQRWIARCPRCSAPLPEDEDGAA